MIRERIPGEAVGQRGAPGTAGGTQSGSQPEEAGSGDAPAVGVLALQGDVLEHVRMVRAAGANAVVVKTPHSLEGLDGLIIPGGESTTIGKLAEMYGLLEPLRKRITEGLPTFGTCAGAILLSRAALFDNGAPAPQPLIGALDTVARRNAFGRQVASFEADLDVVGLAAPIHAVFIRAPWFEDVGEDVEVLASVATAAGEKVVVVRQDRLLACAFHPELAGDGRLHEMFVEMVREAGRVRSR